MLSGIALNVNDDQNVRTVDMLRRWPYYFKQDMCVMGSNMPSYCAPHLARIELFIFLPLEVSSPLTNINYEDKYSVNSDLVSGSL